MDKLKVLQFPGQVEAVSTLKDGTVKLTIYTTQELPAIEMAQLFTLGRSAGWVMFAETPTELMDADVPDTTPEFKGEKSPSQILRNRMFVYYKQKNGETGFNKWYADQLDAYGQKYLEHIN